MATGKRFYWIKLKESFMTSDTVDFLMSQEGGANYVVLYQMLCLKTINTDGHLSRTIGEIVIPYDAEKIQRDCKWFSIDTIRVALNLYKAVGLIYEDVNGTLVLSDHKNLVGSETDWAVQKQRQAASKGKKSLPSCANVENGVEKFHTDIRDRDKDIDIEKEKQEKEKEKNTPQAEAENCPFSKIKDLYHSICKSYPTIRTIDGNRKKAVSARWRTYHDISTFEEVFRIAEASSFLKGENDRNWSADFDWMMKPTNFSKILEHKYDDRDGVSGRQSQPVKPSRFNNFQQSKSDFSDDEKRAIEKMMKKAEKTGGKSNES